MASITSEVSGNNVTLTVVIDNVDYQLYGTPNFTINVGSETEYGLGTGIIHDYPYFVEKLSGAGVGTHKFVRTYKQGIYGAVLFMQGWPEVDYTQFNILAESTTTISQTVGLNTVTARACSTEPSILYLVNVDENRTTDTGQSIQPKTCIDKTYTVSISGKYYLYVVDYSGKILAQSPTFTLIAEDQKPPEYVDTRPEKELLTNLTDNRYLIQMVVGYDFEFEKQYRESDLNVFRFRVKDENAIVALGAGAGLAKFIAQNFKTIAFLIAATIGLSIVWVWRDVESKKVEKSAALDAQTHTAIDQILKNDKLTTDQKTALIEDLLSYAKTSSTATSKGLFDIPESVLNTLMIVVGLITAVFLFVTALPYVFKKKR